MNGTVAARTDDLVRLNTGAQPPLCPACPPSATAGRLRPYQVSLVVPRFDGDPIGVTVTGHVLVCSDETCTFSMTVSPR